MKINSKGTCFEGKEAELLKHRIKESLNVEVRESNTVAHSKAKQKWYDAEFWLRHIQQFEFVRCIGDFN